jgi:hypothetical protein
MLLSSHTPKWTKHINSQKGDIYVWEILLPVSRNERVGFAFKAERNHAGQFYMFYYSVHCSITTNDNQPTKCTNDTYYLNL